MKKTFFYTSLISSVIFVIMFFTSVYLSKNGIFDTVKTVLFDIVTTEILCEAILITFLRFKLSETLFSYTNIAVCGSILFVMILAVVSICIFILSFTSVDFTLQNVFDIIISFPRIFSYFATVLIFGISILLGISNISLIRHEGFCLNNALSLLIAGFYVGGAICVNLITDFLSTSKVISSISNGFCEMLLRNALPLFLVLILCYFECILCGTGFMGLKVVRTKPKHDKDFAIILGCSIDKRGGLLPLLKGRVNRAVRFAWEQEIDGGQSVKYVPSGGQGPNEIMSEGSAMEMYLLAKGAEQNEVYPEKKSKNTYENLRFSKEIIENIKPNAKVVISTTNYHLLRSGILARNLGLDCEGVAGDTKWYFWPNGFIREFFGILAMKKKVHIIVALSVAAICLFIGWLGYLYGMF